MTARSGFKNIPFPSQTHISALKQDKTKLNNGYLNSSGMAVIRYLSP